MGNLRDIVRRNEEEQALRTYYKDKYDVTPSSEKDITLDYLRSEGLIDKKVDEILDTFSKDLEKGSARKSKRRTLSIVYSVANFIIAGGFAYTVRKEDWPIAFVLVCAFIAVTIFYNVFNDNL